MAQYPDSHLLPIDFDDGSKTENTRVSYPIYHIDNIEYTDTPAGAVLVAAGPKL
ncbi:phosphoenolpyruvate carboxykinase (ATP) [Escherichia albertii]|nr:phosphoenolpyruvate carboxykinase (ATP) [Escherichia albertii]EFF0781567.1 phosphoenolpyruvate carboxykinase (ATP) [Escherichia albertii]EFF0796053.1 phosphoenolpyruvate carboxykinase (ATP) [Escherichia albertii]EHG7530230.1 phosphoenolpyruvate carboxykinase (ATP) [Escherichia albertii]